MLSVMPKMFRFVAARLRLCIHCKANLVCLTMATMLLTRVLHPKVAR